MTEQEFRDKYYDKLNGHTGDDLPKFIEKMMSESLEYGSVCCAVAASAIAAAWAANKHKHGGITGFQAGAVMWEFVRQWTYKSNKMGLQIIDFDNLLYPQYEEKFDKTISPECWKALQDGAKANLATGRGTDNVRNHWQSIVDGVVPFGFVVKDE